MLIENAEFLHAAKQNVAIECREDCVYNTFVVVSKFTLPFFSTRPDAVLKSVEQEVNLVKIDKAVQILLLLFLGCVRFT